MLDFDTCNAARLRRDPAFDGVFFTAVKTTGIYCRSICRVMQPLTKNVEYFPTAAAAEHAGYGPCLRCRPESAPFCPAWNGTRTTVARALRLIRVGELKFGSSASLADRLGVSTRHLARLFSEHLGASPHQVAKTTRLQCAKQLLEITSLALANVSASAGYPSLRSMNRAFQQTYGRRPSAFRKGH